MLHRRNLIVFPISLLCLILFAGICRADTEVIPVHYRSAQEVLPVVQSLLSPNGKVTFADRIHSLILTDTPASIQRVRTFLETFDRPSQQVRIRLKFNESHSSHDRMFSGRGRISGKDWSIATDPKTENGVDIRFDDRSEQQQHTTEHMLLTTSGTPAYILTGMDIPYKQHWMHFCRRYAACVDTVQYRRIETGMEILAVIVGDRANIEITPRISQAEPDAPQGVVRFTRASTRLTVPLGQWVELGKTQGADNEVLRAVLQGGSSRENSAISMSLMVETLQ